MTIKASGSSLKFSEIALEFGTPPGKNLGAFRISQTVSGLTLPLDVGIPTTGQIKFSEFYSKRLNIVIDCTPVGVATVTTRQIARSKYDSNQNVTVLGGYKTKPSVPSNVKVWIHTNGTVGSDRIASQVTRTYSSLLTGTWETTTDLRLDIGSDGLVVGAGGTGGTGGDAAAGSSSPGLPGSNGTSAIGVNHTPIIITNRGRIYGGGGGGGGGGGVWTRRRNNRNIWYSASGGGGGGGWGIPNGFGGQGGSINTANIDQTNFSFGARGSNGSISVGGTGGNGGRVANLCSAGGGGGGAADGIGGLNGTQLPPIVTTAPVDPKATSGSVTQGGTGGTGKAIDGDANSGAPVLRNAGGVGGLNGYSIVVANSSAGVTITNTGTIIGVTTYNTAPT